MLAKRGASARARIPSCGFKTGVHACEPRQLPIALDSVTLILLPSLALLLVGAILGTPYSTPAPPIENSMSILACCIVRVLAVMPVATFNPRLSRFHAFLCRRMLVVGTGKELTIIRQCPGGRRHHTFALVMKRATVHEVSACKVVNLLPATWKAFPSHRMEANNHFH